MNKTLNNNIKLYDIIDIQKHIEELTEDEDDIKNQSPRT